MLTLLSGGAIVWCGVYGLAIVNWWPLLPIGAVLLAATFGHRRLGLGGRLAASAGWTLLWIVFSVAGALLAYAAAAHGGPLYDARLAELDAALGFDWNAWYGFVAANPLLRLPLTAAYGSLVAQILLSVVWFSYRGLEHRNAELLANSILALLLTVALFVLFPSLGPCVGIAEFREAYVDDLIGMRNGTLAALDIMMLKGVIPFPSFHTVLAVLFTYAHRGSPTFVPVAALNALMLVSVPSEGGHYLADVLGGIAIATVALLATRAMPASAPVLAPARTA